MEFCAHVAMAGNFGYEIDPSRFSQTELEQVASDNSIPFKAIKIESKEQAQSVPSPCTFQSKNETVKFHLDLSCKRYDLFLVNGFCAAYQSA